MICPKCGKDSLSNICSSCSTDIKQFIKFDNKSVEYYNKGLDLALNNNITMAIEMLNKSIKYNQTNITALNLLGLCYDRIGRVADASRYWVLSCFVDAENVAADYLEKVEKKPSQREKINDTLKMYNKALVYARQDSEDMAIIQLKKAVDLNENFVDALNLLALCYIRTNAKEKALKCIKKVLEIDCGNIVALRYADHLDFKNVPDGKVNKKASGKTTPQRPVNMGYSGVGRRKGSNSIAPALGFLLGALCISLFAFYLIMPSVENSAKEAMTEQTEQYRVEKTDLENRLKEKEEELADLKAENEELAKSKDNYLEAYSSEKVINQVRAASDLYKERNYIDAAIKISEINDQYVVGDDIDIFIEVREGSYDRASLELYYKAVGEYDNKLYQESLDSLNKSVYFGGSETYYYDDILYYMGRNYEGLQEIDTALEYYDKIIIEYPNSDFTSKTKSRINVINS